MGLDDLKQITANLNQPHYSDLLVDFKDNDDCGILKVGDLIIAQSLDFITPVVDDPFVYGQIAAANSLSDVFAKGAEAKSAMSVFMWDSEHLSVDDANAILQGALDKLVESACPLVGGHSINDSEQKFGLSVTGVIENGIFWRNNTAQIGDSIILTKPLGSGILSTAMKNDKLAFSANLPVVEAMRTLNLYAMRIARGFEIHASTDVTGFGLIGHLTEMLNRNISIEADLSRIPLFGGVGEFAKEGIVPGGSYANREALKANVKNTTGADDIIYYDAQTSGGLLLALSASDAKRLNGALNDNGIPAKIIAQCVPKRDFGIYLK